MRKRTRLIGFTLTVLIALAAPSWPLRPVVSGQPADHDRTNSSPLPGLSSFHFSNFYGDRLFSDFDGDNKLDQAELFARGAHQSIYLRLSNSLDSSLSFDSKTTTRGKLLSADIDHDSDVDLIWVSVTQPPSVVIWLGNGRGHFEIAPNTAAYDSTWGMLLGDECGTGVTHSEGNRSVLHASAPSVSFDLALANSREPGAGFPLSTANRNRRRGLAFCLAYLYERGPPPTHLDIKNEERH